VATCPRKTYAVNRLLPTELSLHRALSIARWASLVWTVGVVTTGDGELRHPAAAWIAVGAAFAIAVAGTIGVRAPALRGDRSPVAERGRPWVGGTPFAAVQAVVAFGMVLADGWAFEPGHAFATSQNLAAASPTIAAIAVGIAAGTVPGVVVGALLGAARLPAALLNDVDDFTAARWASLAASAVFIGLWGGLAGWLARTLRTVETEVIVRRERDTIARAMHDTVLQTLAVVARRSDDPELVGLVRRTDTEVRHFLFGPTVSPDRTLESAVHAAAIRAAQTFDVDLVVNVVDESPPATGPRVEALAAAVGEAVTNAGKHAGTVRVVVYAEASDDGLFASVRDDGPGFDVAAATGHGIRTSIRGPVEGIGGRVEIDSSPSSGSEVRLWVP
jgi:signal transduction histidine kinase